MKIFLYSSSVYPCHLFLVSSASVRCILLLSLLCSSLREMFPWYLIFLKKSPVFPIVLFPSTSLHCSLRSLFYLSLLFFRTLHSDGYIFPFLLCLSPLFFSQLFVRSPQTTFCLLSWPQIKKRSSFWSVIFSYSTQQQQTTSWLDCDVRQKLDFPQQPAQWLNWDEAPKHFPMPNLHPEKKKGISHCLVVYCPSDPLQFSESWQNH